MLELTAADVRRWRRFDCLRRWFQCGKTRIDGRSNTDSCEGGGSGGGGDSGSRGGGDASTAAIAGVSVGGRAPMEVAEVVAAVQPEPLRLPPSLVSVSMVADRDGSDEADDADRGGCTGVETL